MNKTSRLIICVFCFILAGVIGYYQFKVNIIGKKRTVPVVVAKANITRGDEINLSNVKIANIDADSLVKGNFTDISKVVGHIATENFRIKEQILNDKIATTKDWTKKDKRLVSITCIADKDTFTAFEVRPLDNVDIYYFMSQQAQGQTSTQPEILKPTLENIEVIDTKNEAGISFRDRVQGQVFIPHSALFLVSNDVADKIETYKSMGGYFSLTIHGQRPALLDSNNKTQKSSNSSSVIFK